MHEIPSINGARVKGDSLIACGYALNTAARERMTSRFLDTSAYPSLLLLVPLPQQLYFQLTNEFGTTWIQEKLNPERCETEPGRRHSALLHCQSVHIQNRISAGGAGQLEGLQG